MTSWFGHTQTVASVSKTVTTVAGGCLALETNFADFMKKVIYYERYIQRLSPNLPEAILVTANRLFARCYEYRDEIRNELESSFAYVADAGRWIVGLEDWNSKFLKRLAQIQELVLLINTLLIEYAILGQLGADGSRDQLDAYLRVISSTVVLQDEQKSLQKGSTPVPAKANAPAVLGEKASTPSVVTALDAQSLDEAKQESSEASGYVQPNNNTLQQAATEPVVNGSGVVRDENECVPTRTDQENEQEDDDSFNPFATGYAVSQRNNAPVGTEKEPLAIVSATTVQEVCSDKENSSEEEEKDGDHDSSSSSSSSNLSEYECLDTDSIPKYVAFRPSVFTRRQRPRFDFEFFGTRTRCPTVKDASDHHHRRSTKNKRSPRCRKGLATSSDSSTSPHARDSHHGSPSESFCSTATSTSAESHSSMTSSHHHQQQQQQQQQHHRHHHHPHHHHKATARAKNKLVDLSVSYDVKCEMAWNPFHQREQDGSTKHDDDSEQIPPSATQQEPLSEQVPTPTAPGLKPEEKCAST